MKAIIQGKRYNTDTATRVGHWWNHLDSSDFNNVEEDLYITKSGNWFLHGCGGADTEYHEVIGKSWYSGERIVPLSSQSARTWLEKYGNIESVEKYFSASVKDA